MTRRRVVVALATLLAAGIGAGASAPASDAAIGSTSTYTATASSRLVGVRFTVVPGLLLDQLVDAGVDESQARLDSLGQSSAFASSPYPSGSVVQLPGLVAGLSKGASSGLVPEYPLIASADQTRLADRKELGSLVLDARTGATESRATVTDGITSGSATTTFDAPSDTVRAHASAAVYSLQLSPTLSIAGVHATADAVQPAGGEVRLTSSFEVAGLSILGQRIAVTPRGLSLLGTEVPLGIDPSALLAPLLAQLATQGTTIEVLPATTTADTITSAGLRIHMDVRVPDVGLASGVDSLPTELTFGLASASVSNRAFDDSPPAPADQTIADVPVVGSSDGFPLLGSATTGPFAIGPATPGPSVPGRSAGSAVVTGVPIATDIPLGRFYPVLLLAGVAGLGAVSILRRLGVRHP